MVEFAVALLCKNFVRASVQGKIQPQTLLIKEVQTVFQVNLLLKFDSQGVQVIRDLIIVENGVHHTAFNSCSRPDDLILQLFIEFPLQIILEGSHEYPKRHHRSGWSIQHLRGSRFDLIGVKV